MQPVKYLHLRVLCFDKKDFPLDQMREAVEYLKQQPQGLTGLQAIGNPVKAGTYLIAVEPMLTLEEIKGKTVKEIWELFDQKVAAHISYFEKR